MEYTPPFKITPLILQRSQEISRELGLLSGAKIDRVPLKLRRINNIKTIQSSLAIEGNTLGIDQVTHIFEGKRVLGPEKDILEVNNAIKLYKNLSSINPLSIKEFLNAHLILMKNLIVDNGRWRVGGVGIFKGSEIAHVAPPAKRVPLLMEDLFEFLSKNKDIPWLLKACIFHYELEFIHPFSDGNGRMGRLWQQLILMKEDAIFEFIPIEVLIKKNQEDYYRVLETCDRLGDSTVFIEFSLDQILASLEDYNKSILTTVIDAKSRLDFTRAKMTQEWFSRKEYHQLHKNISTATASRDLLEGVDKGTLRKKGQRNQVRYSFI